MGCCRVKMKLFFCNAKSNSNLMLNEKAFLIVFGWNTGIGMGMSVEMNGNQNTQELVVTGMGMRENVGVISVGMGIKMRRNRWE